PRAAISRAVLASNGGALHGFWAIAATGGTVEVNMTATATPRARETVVSLAFGPDLFVQGVNDARRVSAGGRPELATRRRRALDVPRQRVIPGGHGFQVVVVLVEGPPAALGRAGGPGIVRPDRGRDGVAGDGDD